MTAADAPVQPVVRQQHAVADLEENPKTTDLKAETTPAPGSDFATRIGLTSGEPQDTLRLLGELTRNAAMTGMP